MSRTSRALAPPGRRARALLAALALLGADAAHAACLPLPSAELRAIDELAAGYPARGVAQAEQRLAAPAAAPQPFAAAQLQAIIAAVLADQGRAADAHAAVTEARRLLGSVPATADVQRLRDRLAISDGSNAATRADLLAAVQSVDEILLRAPADSLDRVCALAARADLRAELLELDAAAADGIAAFSIAERQGLDDARSQAAISLAEIYRRSGLRTEADRMLAEFIAFQRSHDRPAQVAAALYMRGQVLSEARNFGEARTVLEASRRMAEDAGDHFSAMFTDVALCPALIGAGDLDRAERVCSDNVAEFARAGRTDLTTLMEAYRARIDLERGQPRAALQKLDDVLGPHAADVVANLEPQIYLDRARALAALGAPGRAYGDVKHSLELQQSLDREQRARSAAVLKGAADAEKLAATNRLLAERLARQRAELDNRTLTQRLAIAIAVAAALVGGLLGCLLWLRRRHDRELRREQAVLRTVSAHAPDALMLLDRQRRVRFSNRDLFGGPGNAEPGQALDSLVPAEARQPIRQALEIVYGQRRATIFAAAVTDAGGVVRQFELRGMPVIEDGELLGATLRSTDVTQLRRLEREVVDIATRERKRLSTDLHEGLGQDLAGISMLIESLGMDVDRGRPVTRRALSELTAHVNRMIGVTRDMASSLSPTQVVRGSLSSAVARLAAEAAAGLAVEVAVTSDPPDIIVPEAVADHLCRMTVEAVAAAARRRGCTALAVGLTVDSGVLRLTVADAGAGDPAGADAADPPFTELIAYRARLLGGSVEVETGAQGGMRICISVPVPKAA